VNRDHNEDETEAAPVAGKLGAKSDEATGAGGEVEDRGVRSMLASRAERGSYEAECYNEAEGRDEGMYGLMSILPDELIQWGP